MSREFGIYPQNCVPHYWIGARGIINRGSLDIPYDRWSNDFRDTKHKADLIKFVNNEALPELEKRIKKHCIRGFFDSADGRFRCEYDDRSSGGYMYMGFYNITIDED